MLEKLMDDYICPMSRVFPPRVGGLTLDSHHGSVVEYGEHMDIELVLCHGRHWSWCKSYYFWAPGQLSYMVQKHFSVQFFKSSRNIQMIFLLVRRLLTREKRKTTPVSCCIELESLKRDGISASCH
ncbi:PREDICTED: uncharacterized protein LOC105135521 isoform X2 [Populus euphratica]|uniref:Uncharacterized protein LOC105135521 isoform X2 n=1 Tax=Populus euphratica TaxID=75702 RepID=A0AAJ6Y162_POPEU|nr:PREDICTED: uncharacterized protein LOC105135521 isoform X2 [Populus euphratica]XP_011038726.1 PREDICTED: uncharacterized protein LOC105135521 isoform X2 [Populus euphratica]XP_011038727.1 PREDICTED: uncharacterized protein LOC105135521 isoform X2 [Populus euphratica]XP_011038728.1 PREDICTED: uncharacterized protein LOC105135521 isoform X2 [Populus euphratica]